MENLNFDNFLSSTESNNFTYGAFYESLKASKKLDLLSKKQKKDARNKIRDLLEVSGSKSTLDFLIKSGFVAENVNNKKFQHWLKISKLENVSK